MTVGKRTFLVALTVFLIASVLLAIFPPKAPRILLNERRAVESIRTLVLAERDYAVRHPNTGFACNLGDLGENETSRVALVDRMLASGTKYAYRFDIRCPARVGTGAAYTITAVPVEPGVSGRYAFCTNQSTQVWYSENGSPSDCLITRNPIGRKHK